MKSVKDIKQSIKKLTVKSGDEIHGRVLDRLLKVLDKSKKQTAVFQPNIWRIIMKSSFTKLTAAAVIVIVGVLSIIFFEKAATPAYALEQTIQANDAIRYIYIKSYGPGFKNDPKQFWVEIDEAGALKNARWYMPEWDAPEDGAKSVVWRENKLQIWFHGSKLTRKEGGLVTYSKEPMPKWLEDFANASNPRLMVEQLQGQATKGKMEIKIYEPNKESEQIIVKATYLPGSPSYGKQRILYVDKTTKLVTTADFYELKDGQYVYYATQEYLDYNKQIDPKVFTLEDEVPADVKRVDGDVLENRGLPQGDLTDEEIAVKVVREFFGALIAKDYEKAGQIYSGIPAEEMKNGWFGENQVVQIISIGKPTPHPIPGIGGLRVPCKVEIEKNGVKSVWEPYGPFVRMTHQQMKNPRWEIHGGL